MRGFDEVVIVFKGRTALSRQGAWKDKGGNACVGGPVSFTLGGSATQTPTRQGEADKDKDVAGTRSSQQATCLIHTGNVLNNVKIQLRRALQKHCHGA